MTTASLPLTSCATTKKQPESRPFERPDVPDLYDIDGKLCVAYQLDRDQVVMTSLIWKRISRYIIDAEAALDIAEARLAELESKSGPARP